MSDLNIELDIPEEPDLKISVDVPGNPDLKISVDPIAATGSPELQRLCESIESLEDLIDSGAKSVTQDGQTVAFDRADARKRLRQLLERKAILEAAATGASRPRKRRPLINRIDLSDRY